jgi:hypothetical protein
MELLKLQVQLKIAGIVQKHVPTLSVIKEPV